MQGGAGGAARERPETSVQSFNGHDVVCIRCWSAAFCGIPLPGNNRPAPWFDVRARIHDRPYRLVVIPFNGPDVIRLRSAWNDRLIQKAVQLISQSQHNISAETFASRALENTLSFC